MCPMVGRAAILRGMHMPIKPPLSPLGTEPFPRTLLVPLFLEEVGVVWPYPIVVLRMFFHGLKGWSKGHTELNLGYPTATAS